MDAVPYRVIRRSMFFINSTAGVNMKVISRKEAKLNGLSRYYTAQPCKHGHVAERYVSCAICVDCARELSGSKEFKNKVPPHA